MFCSLVSNGQPQTPDHVELTAPWWSFTKTVLAATALSLVRDGLIGLDNPIPDQPFTLRQLLRHEAGLADYGELEAYHAAVTNSESAWSADEMMQRLDGARLRYSPGTGWRYSNVGYLLIGRLIERLTDLTLDEAVTQRALHPLGLTNIRFAKTRADLQTTHLGSASNYDPAWVYHGLLMGPISASSAISGSTPLLRPASQGLASGNADGTNIGRPDSRASMDHAGLWPWYDAGGT